MQLTVLVMILAMLLSACGGQTEEPTQAPAEPTSAPAEPTAAPAEPTEAPAVAEATEPPPMEAGCPSSTLADPMGLEGNFRGQFELGEYEEKAGCMMTFSENPDIGKYNDMIPNNPSELPPVEERLPSEPLVLQPYFEIGKYGGQLDGLSNATEAGTSDLLSLRHVNLVRLDDDYQTLKPDVATGWEWNGDFTELTVHLRKGHKWSDGQPFTADDIVFWYHDLVLNDAIYPTPPSYALIAGEPYTIEALDETTAKFIFPAPYPGYLVGLAVNYIQPFQPKHFYEQYHIKYNPDADALAKEKGFDSWGDLVNEFYGASDWKDVPSPMLKGTFDFDEPTLEAFIVTADTPDGRHLVPNPYFHQVDTVGHQLPYINEIDETYVPDIEVQKLKMTNGEVDYKEQGVLIEDYPLLKENEAKGNYTVDLAVAPGLNQWYSFNTTVKDPELAKIFNDVRFREAMSLAINRDEINEIIYLGQGEPQQFTPGDPTTTSFVTEEDLQYYAQYDPEQANALLDEMGLVDTDGDGFRERLDGSKFSILFQYSTQETSPKMHELIRDYWADVGVELVLKEVTSDEYRQTTNNNDGELAGWGGSGTASFNIATNPEIFVPPFGSYFSTGCCYAWAAWLDSSGAEGTEPPDDIKRLVELRGEFVQYPLGSEESNRIGAEVTQIHLKNLWRIGTVGNQVGPVLHSNTLGNFSPFTVKSSSYWAYTFRPTQWFFKE
jgi:peptide/nickel transport system substrate-binding protein